ncbi:MAG: TetR/AcrR family transcriptional regulator [Candidatus Nanopelagicales bacterium]
MTVARTRAPGRPRDGRVDALVLETALALLAEVGPTGLSVEEVAARAGVGKATIYRRWPTKDDLVVASLGALIMVPEDAPAGSARDGIVYLVSQWWRTYNESPNGMVFQRVMAHAKSNPRLFESFYDAVIEPRRELFRVVLRRGIDTGEIRSDADLELLITLIIGSSVYMNQVRSSGRDPAPGAGAEALVDAVLASFLAR